LLSSEFRTTNASEADYFFVPIWGRAAAFGPPRRNSRYLLEVRTDITESAKKTQLSSHTEIEGVSEGIALTHLAATDLEGP
jgi:hypothetical protein